MCVLTPSLLAENHIINRDEGELDEEAEEAHDGEADQRDEAEGGVLRVVGLLALTDQHTAVLHEAVQRVNNDIVEEIHDDSCESNETLLTIQRERERETNK